MSLVTPLNDFQRAALHQSGKRSNATFPEVVVRFIGDQGYRVLTNSVSTLVAYRGDCQLSFHLKQSHISAEQVITMEVGQKKSIVDLTGNTAKDLRTLKRTMQRLSPTT